MPEVVSEPAEANEGREVGHDQQGPEEGARLRDQEVGGLVGDGARAGRERCFAKRRSRTFIILIIIFDFRINIIKKILYNIVFKFVIN